MTMNFTALHWTSHHLTSLHCTSLHYTAVHCTSVHITKMAPTTYLELKQRQISRHRAVWYKKNPTYGRHQLSRPMRIVAPPQLSMNGVGLTKPQTTSLNPTSKHSSHLCYFKYIEQNCFSYFLHIKWANGGPLAALSSWQTFQANTAWWPLMLHCMLRK